jgi:hypothetical protein
MKIKSYKIADTVFAIDSLHNEVHELCKDYFSEEPIKFTVKIEATDIEYERKRSEQTDVKEGNPIRYYPDSYLETLSVYRHLCEHLINKGILLFHGSVIAVDGAGYLFTAKSGTGKSTHTRLWREYFGERAVMVNDDKPLLQITEHGVLVHGTPWDGKHHLSSNISVPLKAICILNRGVENKIFPITKSEAYPMLLQQTHRPMNAEKMQSVFTLLDKMCKHLKLYRLECNMNPDAVTTAYNGMNMEESK